ncbi:kinesin-like protein KIF28P [Perognathus longimembris pacificus]|uniref:kinesin-like protein KIF28P n=1 Tax=Perognathus longimembris pacificus TaxID=214514 RepID=UPI002018E890|nr:kinesin-like protein KIF28P [Perognathus longimembris pacificus]
MERAAAGRRPAPSDRVRVAVRVRPFSQREKNSGSKCVISMHSRTTTIIQDPKNAARVNTFTFDLAYWSHSGFQKDEEDVLVPAGPTSQFAGQAKVFHDIGRGILDNAWQGYNATLLAYGQTGSGKSYSMMGLGANKGLIPRVCQELFRAMENGEEHREYQVAVSMLEIYNEQIRDLLAGGAPPGGGLRVREAPERGFHVEGLTWVPCGSYEHLARLLARGTRARTTASTRMNAHSSRSHLLVTVQLKQVSLRTALTTQAAINLVDLAGSERQRGAGSAGDRLREGARVNLSLASLGAVISALADAALGKKVWHIPYRASVLTKLLRSALGGNSRTTLIATISPADVCYAETLSTLRYAERAKRVRNSAVVNTWTPAREPGARGEPLPCACGHAADPPAWLPGPRAWAALLEQARREWEQQGAAEAQERQLVETLPHLLNVNEDPQLTGVLKHFIREGSCDAGQAAGNAILLQGLGISDKHASFTNLDGKVTVAPHRKSKVVVNGVPITTRTQLQHLDRVILGSNSTYLYVGFPSERGREDGLRFDYDFFQLERAAAEGVSADWLGAGSGGAGRADPSVLAAAQDYVKLTPLVAEANQMSQDLEKGLHLELKVKNLASSDSRGFQLQKEVMVKVTHQRTREVWIWSKAKFVHRKFLMEELYQRLLDGEAGPEAREDDPFWDPVEAVHVGAAHVWLQALAHRLGLEEQVELLGCEGLEEAVLHVRVTPCCPAGRARGEEDAAADPGDLLGGRMDFQVHLVRCLGVRWMKEGAKRGIQLGYRIYDLPNTLYTKPAWENVNPQIEETVQFAALHVSQEFLNYLQTNALIVDLWGLQEGCAELGCSQLDLPVTAEGHIMVDTKKLPSVKDSSQNTSSQTSELYQKLFKLEREAELLRNINRALREENVILKESLEKTGLHPQALEPSRAQKMPGSTTRLPSASERSPQCGQEAPCAPELARALKAFYRSASAARAQWLRLRQQKPPEDDQMLRPFLHLQSQMLKDFGDLFESSLWKLKNDVALIVKKKREHSLHVTQ